MFYDLNLLCPKRKGKFAVIWLAATRGLAHVKKDVHKVDIVCVCNEILKFVMSDSRSPRHRLSLYLSAKLIYGTVLVYYHQVKTLENEETNRRRVIVNKKRKSKKVTAIDQNLQAEQMRDAPQIERLQIEEINQNITDAIHITLPDEQFTRTRILDEELFGDEGQIDLQLVQVEDLTRVIPQPRPDPIPLTTEQVQPVPDANQIALVEEIEQSPSKRRRTEIRLVSPVVRVEQHGTLSPEGQDRLLMPPPPPPAVPSPAGRRSERIATLPDQLYGRDSPGFRRKGPRRLTFGSISLLSDQHEVHEIELPLHKSPVVKFLSPKSVIPRRSESPTDIVADILRTVAHTEEDIRQVCNDVTTASTSHRLRSRTQIQQPEAVVPHADVAEPETVPEERIPPRQETIPDVPFIPSPRLSRVLPMDNGSIREDIPANIRDQRIIEVIDFIVDNDDLDALDLILCGIPRQIYDRSDHFRTLSDFAFFQRFRLTKYTVLQLLILIENNVEIYNDMVYTSTPLGIETEAKRHSLLLNLIRQLFMEIDRETVTLEMICQPLNRVNVAKTFNGLLHLHAQGYLILKSGIDSVELKEIRRGPRL